MKAKLLAIVALTLCAALFVAPLMTPSACGYTILDVSAAARQYGLWPSNPEYNATIVKKYDIDWNNTGTGLGSDGPINIIDLVTLLYHYGA